MCVSSRRYGEYVALLCIDVLEKESERFFFFTSRVLGLWSFRGIHGDGKMKSNRQKNLSIERKRNERKI